MRKKNGHPVSDSFPDKVFNVTITIITFIFIILCAYPLIYVVSASFSDPMDIFAGKVWLLPSSPTLKGYKTVFDYPDVWIGYGNSVFYTVFGVIFSMFLTTTLAYGLSKKDYPGRALFQNMVIFTMYFGGGLIPFFLLVKQLGLMNTRWAIVIPSALSVFNMIILRNFFEQLPPDLEEAATLDGAGPLRIFWQIDLPLVKPAMATLVLFYAVGRWNEWFNASLFLGNAKYWPMQLELRQILWSSSSIAENIPPEAGRPAFSEGLKAAAVMLTMLPIMMVYPFLQRYFVKGVMIGAIKS